MQRLVLVLSLLTIATLQPTPSLAKSTASLGKNAYKQTKEILSHGPRPSGSKELTKVQNLLETKLQSLNLQVKNDRFVAKKTPKGDVPMRNLIGIHRSPYNRILMLACHLESKWMPKIRFVGANDSASACALVLELIPHLVQTTKNHTLWFVFFDGEEAFGEWSDEDSLYGSRHLAATLKENGLFKSISAMILVDMISDQNLQVAWDMNSEEKLLVKVQKIATRKGWKRHFFPYRARSLDDHIPFAQLGIPVLDLIDFRYGPPNTTSNQFYHNAQDTIDKVSPQSLQIVGEVVLELIQQLDQEVSIKVAP